MVAATWDASVGIGTLALAAVTFVLVCVAIYQARLTRLTWQSQLQPVLVDVPIGVFVRDEQLNENTRVFDDAGEVDVWPGEDGNLEITVPMRNAGAGLALVTSVEIAWGHATNWRGAALHTAIPAGEQTRVAFHVPFPDQGAAVTAIEGIQRDELAVTIVYTDVRGQQLGRTRMWVMKHPDEESQVEYFIDRIELFRGRKKSPFATPSGRGEAVATQ